MELIESRIAGDTGNEALILHAHSIRLNSAERIAEFQSAVFDFIAQGSYGLVLKGWEVRCAPSISLQRRKPGKERINE